jgi:glycerol uptake facilitator-like aquaporin
MLRKNSQLGSRRLLGIMYIVAQYLGGIIAAIVSRFLISPVVIKSIAVHPDFSVAT